MKTIKIKSENKKDETREKIQFSSIFIIDLTEH